jgi:AraC family transcriptional regulator
MRVSLFRYRGGGHAEVPALPGDSLSITLDGGNILERRLEGTVERGCVRPGDITLVPRGLASQWHPHPDATALVVQLYLPPSLVADAMHALELDPASSALRDVFVAPDPLLAQLGGALVRELQAGAAQGYAYRDVLTHALLLHVARHYRTHATAPAAAPTALSAAAVRRVQEYIEAHLDQRLGIEVLAAVAALSPFHFSRLFRAATGASPHQYIIQRRVERIRELLPTSTLSLAQLARAVGFANQSHMTEHFRRIVGVTPAEYRRHSSGAQTR